MDEPAQLAPPLGRDAPRQVELDAVQQTVARRRRRVSCCCISCRHPLQTRVVRSSGGAHGRRLHGLRHSRVSSVDWSVFFAPSFKLPQFSLGFGPPSFFFWPLGFVWLREKTLSRSVLSNMLKLELDVCRASRAVVKPSRYESLCTRTNVSSLAVSFDTHATGQRWLR